jgi:predicted GIY-YIG superfamily endonuclease
MVICRESNVLSLSKDFLMHFVYILQCGDGSYYVGLQD